MDDAQSLAKADADGWDIKDTHEENISFVNVAPVNIEIRQISVDVAIPKGFSEIFRKKTSDLETANPGTKRILDSVSANFPKGSLSAIMGGSGSGKVCAQFLLSDSNELCFYISDTDNSSDNFVEYFIASYAKLLHGLVRLCPIQRSP
jgi:ABC-type glutathione transport system ATPase component